MATGLAIMGCLLLVAVTSYARNRIKYEIFYYVHHFVFIMFALAIAHTLDDKARRGQVRSQNFKWFSASLVWYLTDRLQASFNMRDCDVVECVALGDDEPESRKVVHLRIVRPETFIFRPGQYVFINDRNIDYTWHPYSIASSPHEDTIDFYIEVMSTSRVDGQIAGRISSGATPGMGLCPKFASMDRMAPDLTTSTTRRKSWPSAPGRASFRCFPWRKPR